MTMKLTRRDLLALTGGSAVGVMLTPAPWKLIDDLAIWTQNWSWIPVPPKGPETAKLTTCPLCPSGCAVRVRCIGGLPVSLHGVAGDVASGGSLCALGMTAHHLPWHPARLANPVRLLRRSGSAKSSPLTEEAAVRECARAIGDARAAGTAVVVLDTRPQRSASFASRAFLAHIERGTFVGAPGREGISLSAVQTMTGSRSSFGADLGNARTILSFGAPLAEGWADAATLRNLLADDGLELVQIEPVRSRTAEIADRWLPARPGTEATVALAIAHVLLSEGLVSQDARAASLDLEDYAALTAEFTPERAAAATGIRATDIVSVARRLAAHSPALVIAGEDAGGGRLGHRAETAILGLNLLLGNINHRGGLIEREELPAPIAEVPFAPLTELSQLADGSVGALLIDASAGDSLFPWSLVARKLAPAATVIALSPYLAGSARYADIVVPTPLFLESLHEVPSSDISPEPRFAIAGPVVEPRFNATDPVRFFRLLAAACEIGLPEEWETSEDLVRARSRRIHEAGEGTVVNVAEGSETGVTEFGSPDEMFDALLAGARWCGETNVSGTLPPFRLLADLGERLGASRPSTTLPNGVTLMPHATRDVTSSAASSPLLSKIYQESSLRLAPSSAVVNPATVRELGLRSGRRALLKTAAGTLTVNLVEDQAVMPGVVQISAGPDAVALGIGKAALCRGILDICGVDEDGVWRSSAAQLVEA